MFEISVQAGFSAAHRLRHYQGRCEDLHGHNWKVWITVASKKLDKVGMLIDFRKLKEELARVLNDLDHQYLNEKSYFKQHNPTSENIAKYIYDKLNRRLAITKYQLKITVWETETASASYAEG